MVQLKQIDLVYRTMYAELAQRSLDASFDSSFSPTGNFLKVPVKGHDYWYFEDTHSEPRRRYVGPASDPEIDRRVANFQKAKSEVRARRKLVSTLIREATLPAPDRLTGAIVHALERAGLFRLRGVLVGTVAFQAYAGYLGVRLPGAVLQTADADFAQFHSIATAVEDSLPPILEVLSQVDPTFRPIPNLSSPTQVWQYANATQYKVEFLTPNRGSNEYTDKPAPMPSLGGSAAQALRFLDFLIYQPVRAILLHAEGVPINVPAPSRYAVHKLIVASRRLTDAGGMAKRDKDVYQARLLFEALQITRNLADLADSFVEAWDRGPHWQEAIAAGLAFLQPKERATSLEILSEALREGGYDALRYLPSTP
jgi:hypothetical protein